MMAWLDRESSEGSGPVSPRDDRRENEMAQVTTSVTKQCKSCLVDKPIDQYGIVSKRPDGHDYICKTCVAVKRAAMKQASALVTAAMRAPAAPKSAPLANVPAKVKGLTTADTDFQDNPEALATFAAASMVADEGGMPANLLWIGPSGSGKTEQARALARKAGLSFTKIDSPSMTDPEAWFGTREVIVVDGAPQTVVNDSAFVTAIQKPGVLLLDEFNRVSDAVRQIILGATDDTRQITNPLTGRPIERHPLCVIVMTANVGLQFTGTYAIDPAFYTRSLTTVFGYLDAKRETALAISRTGVEQEIAALFVRFANETRERNKSNEDFPPLSTREVLTACGLVAKGLDADIAARQAMINAKPADGGAESIQGQLEMIWTGIHPKAQAAGPTTPCAASYMGQGPCQKMVHTSGVAHRAANGWEWF